MKGIMKEKCFQSISELKAAITAQLKAFMKEDFNVVLENGKNVRINVWQTGGNILKKINCNWYILP